MQLNDAQFNLNNTEVKLNNTVVKLNDTEVKLHEANVKLNDNEDTTRELMDKFDTLQGQLNDTQKKMETKFATLQKQLNGAQSNFEKTKKQVIKLERNQVLLRQELNSTKVKLNNTEVKLNENQKKLEKFEKPFVWKINNFSNILKQAKAREKTFFTSDPFYLYSDILGSCGYKLKVRIDPNGGGSGENTHLSVYIYVMKGEYDAILPWPINKKVIFTLIDQQENPVERENVTSHFLLDKRPQFARPVGEENEGMGFAEFISHDKLNSRRYIVDDTLFLEVKLGPSSG